MILSEISKKKKNYDPFLWMGLNCIKTTEPLPGGSLLFITKFPETSGTHSCLDFLVIWKNGSEKNSGKQATGIHMLPIS